MLSALRRVFGARPIWDTQRLTIDAEITYTSTVPTRQAKSRYTSSVCRVERGLLEAFTRPFRGRGRRFGRLDRGFSWSCKYLFFEKELVFFEGEGFAGAILAFDGANGGLLFEFLRFKANFRTFLFPFLSL